jgi:hypothetical protein
MQTTPVPAPKIGPDICVKDAECPQPQTPFGWQSGDMGPLLVNVSNLNVLAAELEDQELMIKLEGHR